MGATHNYSFFGQTNSMLIQSSSKYDPYLFIKCLKKKSDGSWEKPSKGEGKTIKLSLEEMVMILEVLNKNIPKWSGFHSFKDQQTQISVNWEDTSNQKLWIRIGGYAKYFTFSQIEIFRRLINHILDEKIEFATAINKGSAFKVKGMESRETPSETRQNSNNATEIEAIIKNETEKAILVQLITGKEMWIPKSGIKSNYTSQETETQKLLVDSWILEKSEIKA